MNCLASWVVFWSVSVPAGSPPTVPGASGPSSLHGGVLKASLQQFLAYGDPDQGCGGTSRGDGKVSHMWSYCHFSSTGDKNKFHCGISQTAPHSYILFLIRCNLQESQFQSEFACQMSMSYHPKQEELYCAWCGVWVLLKWGWFVVHVQSANTYLSEVAKLVVECPGLFTL